MIRRLAVVFGLLVHDRVRSLRPRFCPPIIDMGGNDSGANYRPEVYHEVVSEMDGIFGCEMIC